MANLLLFAWVFLIVFSISLISSNGLLAFLTFILSFVVLAAWSNTPEAKAIRSKQEAEAKRAELAAAKAAEGLEKNFQQLSKDPTNTKALDYVLDVLEDLSKEKLKPLISSTILPLLKLKPLDERVRATVFSAAKKSISRSASSAQVSSKAFYDAALDILQQHPEQMSLKQYALEVGRWHYCIARADGKVTIYDEQSIQNDILVRSK
ncbi:MAG TPA: hypothetical protein V6D13_14080 [Halomicronema sp.]